MSATLETVALEKYMAPCEVLTSAGRTFPVEIEYLERSLGETPVWEAAADEVERMARASEGDMLIFMPGAFEIGRTIQAIRNSRAGSQFFVLPLHGELPVAEQDAAVARYEKRKVIVSTNVAETSLTIEGVRVVIDAGLAKIARFDPYRGINTLLVERISRASADQRAGRAGRTAPGVCVRLWTEREHGDRPAQELPEVRRLDLAEVVLTLKASAVREVAAFRWLEPPDPRSLERALTLLSDLGALDAGRRPDAARPAHARLSGTSSLRADAARGRRAGLRARRSARGGAHAGPADAPAGGGPGDAGAARRSARRRNRVRFFAADARAPLCGGAWISGAGVSAAGGERAGGARSGGTGGAVPAHCARRGAFDRRRARPAARRSAAVCWRVSPIRWR